MRKLIAAMVVASAVAGIGAMPVFAEEGQVKQEKRERQRQDKPKKERDFTPVKGEITAVDGNKITDEAIERLRGVLPNCSVLR